MLPDAPIEDAVEDYSEPAVAAKSLVDIVIPDATLPAIDVDSAYEPLIRHMTELPADVAPPLGSAATLVSSIRSDAGAGLSRDIPNDYIQGITILRELSERIDRVLMTFAVIATSEGVSIVTAAEKAGIAPNTLRKRLAHTTTSLAKQGGADESPF
ncbi:hypothetical protein GCM10025867_47670 (plasmid) [Frondihabitans sucicola]|uniref:DNA binding HTH domain-containing protein n=1 Tax=Frondihabitans sucicola TaxID=1268041 RepID=A0ABM8GVL9_9MICO|nr:hypothetical protein [Frondihabitans sucicola]BDZ52526.1 hypothetical protein GCM10025867_47670 [Frondihabitans sucicola]